MPQTTFPQLAGAEHRHTSAPAGPPIRRPVLVRDGNQQARAPRGNQFAASCVSYDSRLERPGVADYDLNTRDRNR
jgi:hypothetical protein